MKYRLDRVISQKNKLFFHNKFMKYRFLFFYKNINLVGLPLKSSTYDIKGSRFWKLKNLKKLKNFDKVNVSIIYNSELYNMPYKLSLYNLYYYFLLNYYNISCFKDYKILLFDFTKSKSINSKPYLFLNSPNNIMVLNKSDIVIRDFLLKAPNLKSTFKSKKRLLRFPKTLNKNFNTFKKPVLNKSNRTRKSFRFNNFLINRDHLYRKKFFMKLKYIWRNNKCFYKNIKNTKSNLSNKLFSNLFFKTNNNLSYLEFFKKNNSNLQLSSKVGKNFIFKNFGFFLKHNLRYFSNKLFRYKYNFKKLIFSFLFPNQVKKNIMNKKRRIIISRFFYKNRNYSPKSFRFSVKLLKNNFKKYYNYHLLNKSFFYKTITNDSFNNSKINNYQTSYSEILYPSNYSNRGNDYSFKLNEVHIKRVRFKPGYQRIWRNARISVKESLNLKFKYQYTLTKYLTRFFNQTKNYYFSTSDMTLKNIVMYSKLLPDVNTFNNFLQNKLIYVNGGVTIIPNQVLVKSDFIQFIVSQWYYIMYRWLSNWTNVRTKKFKRLVYRKGLALRHKLMKTKKQKSNYTPLWIHNTRYDLSDVKPYLEVDYFTLSVFILYDPFFLYYSSPDDLPDSRVNIYKLYNWKYIN